MIDQKPSIKLRVLLRSFVCISINKKKNSLTFIVAAIVTLS
jgi:hypothetical protein